MMNLLKGRNLFFQFSLIVLLAYGCKNQEDGMPKVMGKLPEIKTLNFFKMGRLFKVRGELVNQNNLDILEKGICYDTVSMPSIYAHKNCSDTDFNVIDKYNAGFFTFKLVGLEAATTNFVRAYAITKDGISYGNELVLTTDAASSLVVGDNFGGGKLVYIFESGDSGYVEGEVHGIIAASNDLNEGYIWGGGFFDGLGGGKLNSIGYVNQLTAADACNALTLNGYDDWYLPCRMELELVMDNMEAIGNFTEGPYWSSTHSPIPGNPGFADPTYGYSFYIFLKMYKYAVYDHLYSNTKYKVRPIRYF
jgi:hypothetical protein